MSLINAFGNCCCDPIGHCCCSDFSNEQNCFGCLDDKTKAQCDAINGCRWVAGTCAENPCLGVCCVTDASDCYVDCVDGVTECECFFEHQTAQNTATFTPGALLICEDVGCPCNCAPHCWMEFYLLIQDTEYVIEGCYGECTKTYTRHQESVGMIAANEYPCELGQQTPAQIISYWASLSTSTSWTCNDGDGNSNQGHLNVTNSGTLLGRQSFVSACIPATPINIHNALDVVVCTMPTGVCQGVWPSCGNSYSVSVPYYFTPGVCVVSNQFGCVHQCEPNCTEA